ncbi:MAG: M20/M25/M40 family metallo-hydrolase [Ruminococcaceae bacterium]|nr:M20/M25/M40 family metallo-hydrolase [Oscillospiraceae bacterium]
MIWLGICAALILLFLAVVLVRTLRFRPGEQTASAAEAVEFDRDGAVRTLAALVRCRTVSYCERALEDDAEFDKLTDMLPQLFPHVAQSCDLTRLPGRALLFRWAGKAPGEPAVFMAHYDVVPAAEEGWSRPPFAAVIEDGALWGRGTLDTKVTLNGILAAADHLIAQGFVPEYDVYFAFSGGEEISGPGAANIVDYFAGRGITPALVLDEGGAVVQGVFPGVSEACAIIGIAEKGMMNVEFSVQSNGGHASAPLPQTPIGRLAAACTRVEAHPFRAHLSEPARMMFDTLGRHSGFAYRMIFANLWCFGGVLNAICRKKGGELNALMRTTVAFTQMQGSEAANVLPSSARMVANIRLNPMDSVASATEHLRRAAADDGIALRATLSEEPSRISRTDCAAWEHVCAAVRDTWPGSIVAPYLMVQCSDSRHYGRISDRVYRFSAMDLTEEERRSIHGVDEHIRLETIGRSVEFFIRLMKRC